MSDLRKALERTKTDLGLGMTFCSQGMNDEDLNVFKVIDKLLFEVITDIEQVLEKDARRNNFYFYICPYCSHAITSDYTDNAENDNGIPYCNKCIARNEFVEMELVKLVRSES